MTTPIYALGKLTGRTRYRKSFFGKIILQVEHSLVMAPGHPMYNPLFEPIYNASHWRDAKITDMDQIRSIKTECEEIKSILDGDEERVNHG